MPMNIQRELQKPTKRDGINVRPNASNTEERMQQTQSKTSCKIFNDTLCNIHTLHTFQHASGPVIYFRLQTHRENTRNKKKYIYEFDAATLRRVYTHLYMCNMVA